MRPIASIPLALLACAYTTTAAGPQIVATHVSLEADDRMVAWQTNPANAPVNLVVSTPRPGLNEQVVLKNTTSSNYVWNTLENQRTYFSLETQEGDQQVTALRVLPLEGGRNFRDLGGYETEDGRQVKWGVVYRSGVLHGLTDEDYAFIDGLGIETVIDFRANSERRNEPTDWRAGEPSIVTWDYESIGSDKITQVFQNPELKPADVENVMVFFYRSMFKEYADKYAVMFDRLVKTDAPLAFHCTAGKDRTGLGTALLLTALGVPRDTIVEDYAMSDDVVDYMADLGSRDLPEDSPYAIFARLPQELVAPLMASNPRYIEAALDQIDQDYGSVLEFIQSELGVDNNELDQLRQRLLTD